MKKHIKKLRDLFTEPWIPFGPFFIAIVLMGVASYAAVKLGDYSRPTPVAASSHYAVGDTLALGGVAVKVESFRYDLVGNSDGQPDPGYEFLIPTVDVTNHRATNLEMTPLLFFYIKDAQGNIYNVISAPVRTDQLGGPVLPGENVREEVAFQVPIGVDHPSLYFAPGSAGDPVAAIDLWQQ